MIEGLYFILPDPAPDPIGLALMAVNGGARTVQLRCKTMADPELRALGHALKRALAPYDVRLIVNDRADIARVIGADGVHIGQSDGDPVDIRGAIGPDMILGLSIENPSQIFKIPANTIDYIGAGPVFDTATKPDHAPAISMTGLQEIVAASPVPAVAIGGLAQSHVADVKATGAAGIAVISAISGAANPEAAARALSQAWRAA